jgi:DNA-binding GntR family transcriptional regulator
MEPVPKRPPISESVPSCAEWLAGILRDRIVAGEYKPGQHIREVTIQHEFGVSNGPVREALQALVADGLAERPQRRGVRVVALSDEEIVQLFEVRLALFETAVLLAAKRGPQDVLEQADALRADMRAISSELIAGSHPSWSGRLSAWIFRAAGNPKLTAMWERVVSQSLVYVNASLKRSSGRTAIPFIFRLIDDIVARDVDAARESARRLTQQSLIDLGLSAESLNDI